jgi:hypothetical protein
VRTRIALLTWTRGEGMRGGPETTFELEVPEPSIGQRFRAPGLASPCGSRRTWGRYHDDKNWVGLDWTLDGPSLVLAHDEKDPERHRALAITRSL